MSQYAALMWSVKPGTEAAVEELLKTYGRPATSFAGEDVPEHAGRLISTQVFMRDNVVVRVMEFEGNLPALIGHLRKQPAIRELEDKLDAYLERERDLSTPEGAREFFEWSSMRCVVARRYDDVPAESPHVTV